VLRNRHWIWLVLQLGEPVAGTALEARFPSTLGLTRPHDDRRVPSSPSSPS
jgi:hypothetical protein